MPKNQTSFQPGHRGGPGRKSKATERAYLEATIESCSVDDWREICDSAVEAAKGGDRHAREFLRKSLIGDRPPTPSDLEAERIAGVADQILLSKIEAIVSRLLGGLASPDEIAEEAEKLLTNTKNEESTH